MFFFLAMVHSWPALTCQTDPNAINHYFYFYFLRNVSQGLLFNGISICCWHCLSSSHISFCSICCFSYFASVGQMVIGRLFVFVSEVFILPYISICLNKRAVFSTMKHEKQKVTGRS